MNDDMLRQLVQDRYKLTPEQADEVIATVRRAAGILQESFQRMFDAVCSALNDWRKSDQYQELLQTFQAMQSLQEKASRPAYRSRKPSEQGYNRTPYDRWRNSLGGGRRRR